MTHPVIITRPEPGATALAKRLRGALGPDATIIRAPLLRIATVPGGLPDLAPFRGIVLTSAHAVASLGEQARALPCYCVGSATARAARAAGLEAIDGGGDAQALFSRIKAEKPPTPLLYARGEHVSANLAERLSRAGIETHEAVVYRQDPLPLTQEARQRLDIGQPVVIPLFSARTAQLFFAEVEPTPLLRIAAISETVASAVPNRDGIEIEIAGAPTLDSMVGVICALATTT